MPTLSWSGLSRPSISPLAPALGARWILGTSPRMTQVLACRGELAGGHQRSIAQQAPAVVDGLVPGDRSLRLGQASTGMTIGSLLRQRLGLEAEDFLEAGGIL